METIEIRTETGTAMAVTAEVRGLFAIHPTLGGIVGQFQLTHLPSGWAFLERVTRADAEACAEELSRSALDWSAVHTQEDLTPVLKAEGRAMREKYQSDPVIHRQRRTAKGKRS